MGNLAKANPVFIYYNPSLERAGNKKGAISFYKPAIIKMKQVHRKMHPL